MQSIVRPGRKRPDTVNAIPEADTDLGTHDDANSENGTYELGSGCDFDAQRDIWTEGFVKELLDNIPVTRSEVAQAFYYNPEEDLQLFINDALEHHTPTASFIEIWTHLYFYGEDGVFESVFEKWSDSLPGAVLAVLLYLVEGLPSDTLSSESLSLITYNKACLGYLEGQTAALESPGFRANVVDIFSESPYYPSN